MLWCVAALTLVAALGAAHGYALPTPQPFDAALVRAVRAARDGEERVVLHFLYAECKCSRRIFAHLRARRAQPGTSEQVVLVGGEPALRRDLRAAGFRVTEASAEELEVRYGVRAAPLLVIAGRGDAPVYVGGYTTRKQGLEVEDLHILSRIARGESVPWLPLFGCAVSERLQRMIDPLGLKYAALSLRSPP